MDRPGPISSEMRPSNRRWGPAAASFTGRCVVCMSDLAIAARPRTAAAGSIHLARTTTALRATGRTTPAIKHTAPRTHTQSDLAQRCLPQAAPALRSSWMRPISSAAQTHQPCGSARGQRRRRRTSGRGRRPFLRCKCYRWGSGGRASPLGLGLILVAIDVPET